MRIGIVAGEASGDLLAAGLIQAVRAGHPEIVFEGIAGPSMIAAGCKAIYPAEKLAVMGLVEVLAHYRELRGIRRALIEHFIADPPDLFIGVDAPDFNLGLEAAIRSRGIRTMHYVSPSVWAWRSYRLRKIAGAVDMMLTLFPFEEAFYRQHQVPVRCVGHPLADMIPLEVDRAAARAALGMPETGTLVALLPGSRRSEVGQLGGLMAETAVWLARRRPDIGFIAPLVTGATRAMFEARLRALPDTPAITLIDGRSREVMAAADVVVLASGTATLEAMLLKRPMVVTYRVAPLTYWLLRRMVRVSHIALPNLLAGRALVPELIQHAATAEGLGAAVLAWLDQPERNHEVMQQFDRLHRQLRRDANSQAAAAVLNMCGFSDSD